ncbi:TIGR00282 family metallophosphoesterase [Bryobacter aggregatus]|uniref:TIGR00282 family metallophosphoesterase n=1 Tax=Bryobacter aggregatus TaxID=360054 RepID=UPI0004E0DE16|nr:TIGR00282 family metallophosphoesterase [Bryobacter aggregatus]
MNLLFIGDVYSSVGRNALAWNLAELQATYGVQMTIVNAENAAGGFGVTPQIADDMLSLGVDAITTGNHVWDKRDFFEYLDRNPRVTRPANYPKELPGRGLIYVEARNGVRVAILNLQGRALMTPLDCPFRKADELIAEIPTDVKVRFVDFHAELTSEKVAMGWHLDGRVSAVIGTHTHIPTADTRILAGGTAYQTDAGMTGPYDGVIGADKELVLKKFLTSLPVRLEASKKGGELHGVVIDIDETTGQARSIERVTRKMAS